MTLTGGRYRSRESIVYFAVLIVVVAAYLGIRAIGDTMTAPALGTGSSAAKLTQIHVNDFLHVLLALALVIACARILGAIFRWIKQPPVVGEMIAGILLGPSLLGHVAPSFAAYLLPQSIAPLLNVISQFGVILYMFLVGLDLDVSSLRGHAQATIAISHASIVTPFLLGSSLALLLYPQLSNSSVSFTSFSLFLGVSMSVTAFPVLARILSDRGIHKTRMGVLTLTCAAIDDVSAWCLLAFVVSVTQARSGSAVKTLLMAAAYVVAMLFIVRPLMTRFVRWVDEKSGLTQGVLALVLLAILFSSLTTESIGIHSIFGAFVLGAIIPSRSVVARELTGKLEDFVIVFLLPAFFAFTGLRTQIGLVSGARNWMFCLLILLVASLGKFGGSFVAARFCGLSARDSSALGVLMNTRGLMELIVLNIGLELRVISPTLFAMLVLMALATTLATTPILHFVMPKGVPKEEAGMSEETAEITWSAGERTGILIPASSPRSVEDLVEFALPLMRSDAVPARVLAINRARPNGVGSIVREEEMFALSRSPVLSAALDAAWSRKLSITPEAIWTTDTVAGIVGVARRTQVRWVILESRHALLGPSRTNSVVSRLMEDDAMRPVNIAVRMQAGVHKAPISCVVGGPLHGTAATELARLLLPAGAELRILTLFEAPEEWLERALAGARAQVAKLALTATAGFPKGLVIVARDVAEQIPIAFEQRDVERTFVLVKGASALASEADGIRRELFQRSLPALADA